MNLMGGVKKNGLVCGYMIYIYVPTYICLCTYIYIYILFDLYMYPIYGELAGDF